MRTTLLSHVLASLAALLVLLAHPAPAAAFETGVIEGMLGAEFTVESGRQGPGLLAIEEARSRKNLLVLTGKYARTKPGGLLTFVLVMRREADGGLRKEALFNLCEPRIIYLEYKEERIDIGFPGPDNVDSVVFKNGAFCYVTMATEDWYRSLDTLLVPNAPEFDPRQYHCYDAAAARRGSVVVCPRPE